MNFAHFKCAEVFLVFAGDADILFGMTSNYLQMDDTHRIYAIRGLLGSFHLLHDGLENKAVLIDTGLFGELPQLRKLLRDLGLNWHDIQAILLTHGHLDHTGNLGKIKELTGAPLLAHSEEQAHINGTYPYTGPSRVCGILEQMGRSLFRYKAVTLDQNLTPNLDLPYWGGLRVISLPGHTKGHCGFFSPRFNLLFSGDLFASYAFSVHPPPSILNSVPDLLENSLDCVQSLNPKFIIPNHYHVLNGDLHRRRFRFLMENRGIT